MLDFKITSVSDVVYDKINMPSYSTLEDIPEVPSAIYQRRVEKFTTILKQQGIDMALIYGDREHFQNFEYFFGIDIWFEEAIGIIHNDGRCFALLGNECYPLKSLMKINAIVYLCPVLSLPGQPQDEGISVIEGLKKSGLKKGNIIGCVGWKHFPNSDIFDTPEYILQDMRTIIGTSGKIINITKSLSGPGIGLRNYIEPEQAALFEYSSCVISDGMLDVFHNVKPDMRELDIAAYLNPKGLPLSCFTNVSSGYRTKTGLVSPSSKKIGLGEPITLCWAMRGALSCRSAFVAHDSKDLPLADRDYMDSLVKPYFATAVTWLENMRIGMSGEELYNLVSTIFPKEAYGWTLNPGHFLSMEEWINSPVFEGSKYVFESGNALQLDIIPNYRGHLTCNIEDGILLADESYRKKLEEEYPKMWRRILQRKKFLKEELGIKIRDEVLPLYDTQGILNPYLLNKGYAMKKRSN